MKLRVTVAKRVSPWPHSCGSALTTNSWSPWDDYAWTGCDNPATWGAWCRANGRGDEFFRLQQKLAAWTAGVMNSVTTTDDVVCQTWEAPVSKRQYRELRIQTANANLARRRAAAEARAREVERVAAEARGYLMLDSCLAPDQRRDLAEKGRFYLHTASGKKYRIDRGTHGNVKLVDETDRELVQYCIQPPNVPVPDAMLAQKLLLETDEETFLKVANARPIVVEPTYAWGDI